MVYCPSSSSRTRQGPLPVPHDTSRHDLVPATPGPARQARGPSRALAASLGRRWYASVRALPRMWRTVPCDASSTVYAAALQRALAQLSSLLSHAGLFVPATLSRTALMEPPMFGFMEPLTGADLWSRTG